MANLTAATFFRSHNTKAEAYEAWRVTNALQLRAGSLVFVDQATGLVVKPADTATFRFLGIVVRDVLGNTAALPPTEAEINVSGLTLERVTVAGVDAIDDVGDMVFIASTDNPNDMSLTPTVNTKAVGVVTRWYNSGTLCDVRLFAPGEYMGVPA